MSSFQFSALPLLRLAFAQRAPYQTRGANLARIPPAVKVTFTMWLR